MAAKQPFRDDSRGVELRVLRSQHEPPVEPIGTVTRVPRQLDPQETGTLRLEQQKAWDEQQRIDNIALMRTTRLTPPPPMPPDIYADVTEDGMTGYCLYKCLHHDAGGRPTGGFAMYSAVLDPFGAGRVWFIDTALRVSAYLDLNHEIIASLFAASCDAKLRSAGPKDPWAGRGGR